ncbi:uncharacterized protein LOC119707631 [Motacilla alba alba]|uniref:uncharacterized protein LOC119707631 n=1 Tax=Motacilla alba alba TaxID=1094192 RepID=UPI0018D58D9B|nr:uncharacterized protein LOC119707631 [Motacilla alba alba]
MQPGWPHHSTPGRQKLQNQLQGQLPAKPLLSHPTMECRAEINKFAIFLFCLLVPLGSMAPTQTSESRMTTGQRQNHFTTEIPTYASVIQQKAHELFEFYHKCISPTLRSEFGTVITPEPSDMTETIPTCPAFQANCCALHHIHNALKTLRGDIETFCNKSSKGVVQANLNQLGTTLRQGTAFYTCSPPQVEPRGHSRSHAETKNYIWWVLKKYEDIMKLTGKLYSEAAV